MPANSTQQILSESQNILDPQHLPGKPSDVSTKQGRATILPKARRSSGPLYWVLVRGFSLSYHSKETILFTIDPHYGNSNNIPLTRTPCKNPAFGSPGFLLAGVFGEAGSLEVSWNMMFSGLSGT